MRAKRQTSNYKKLAEENPDLLLEKLVHLDEKAKKDRRDFRVKAERDKLQRLYETYSSKSLAEAQREAQERLEAAAIEQNNLLLEQQRQQQLQFQQYQQKSQQTQTHQSEPQNTTNPEHTLSQQSEPIVSTQNEESEQQSSEAAPFAGFFNYDDSSDDDDDDDSKENTQQKAPQEQSNGQPVDDEQVLKAKARVIESAATTGNMNIVVGSGMVPHSVRAVSQTTKPKKKVFRITSSSVTNETTASQHIVTETDEEFRKYMESMRELGAIE